MRKIFFYPESLRIGIHTSTAGSNDYRAQYDLRPLVIHVSYLINLGAPPSVTREKSIAAFSGELERALLIGAE